MSSKLDTAMNRGMAMVVRMDTQAMLERARQLEAQYPAYCWVSDISSERDPLNRPLLRPTFYYFTQRGAYWVNEDWIQTGRGTPTIDSSLKEEI